MSINATSIIHVREAFQNTSRYPSRQYSGKHMPAFNQRPKVTLQSTSSPFLIDSSSQEYFYFQSSYSSLVVNGNRPSKNNATESDSPPQDLTGLSRGCNMRSLYCAPTPVIWHSSLTYILAQYHPLIKSNSNPIHKKQAVSETSRLSTSSKACLCPYVLIHTYMCRNVQRGALWDAPCLSSLVTEGGISLHVISSYASF